MDQPLQESYDVHSAAEALQGVDLFGEESDQEEPEGSEDTEGDEGEAPESTESTEESADDQQEDAEGADDAEQEGEEHGSIESMADLAEALGQDLDTVQGNLKATVKINGEEHEVTLKDLISGYQLEAVARAKTQQLANERREFETTKQREVETINQNHHVLAQVFQRIEQAWMGSIDGAALERLRAEDPAAYAVARQDIADRQRQFQEITQLASQAYHEQQQTLTTGQREQIAAHVAAEREKLLSAVPDWSDTERDRVFNYLQSTGYDPQELSSVFDHRAIVVARKAMLYDEMSKKTNVASQKVRKLPKLLKPAPKTAPITPEKAKLKTAKNRFAQTRNVKDAAALIEQLI